MKEFNEIIQENEDFEKKEQLRKEFKYMARTGNLEAMKEIIKKFNTKEHLKIEDIFGEVCLDKNFKIINYLLFSEDLKSESHKITNKEFAFTCACSKGDLEEIKYLKDRLDIKKQTLGKGLELACIFNHLKVVQYLLTDKTLKEHADIHHDNDVAILKACKHGNLEIVKYLLESKELKDHANMHAEMVGQKDYPFLLAAEYDKKEVVKYLINLKNKNKPSIDSGEHGVLKEFLLRGDLNMVRFVVENENIDIHLDEDYCFTFANQRKYYHILKYFIFNLDIERTPLINKQLLEFPDIEIEEMFNKRTLNKILVEKSEHNSQDKKIKEIKKI